MIDDPEEGLTLPEMRLRKEGDALIEQLQGANVKYKPVLGPDGKPMEGVQLAEGELPAQMQEDTRAKLKTEMNEQLDKMRKASRAEMDAALAIGNEVLDDNPLALKLSQAMLTMYQALAWAKLELQMSDARIDDTVLTHMERQVQTAVYHGDGFYAEQLLKTIPANVIHLLNKQSQKYQKVIKARRSKIKAVISQFEFNGKTLTLPSEMMALKFPKKQVQLGSLIVLTGTPEAVREALLVCLRTHRRSDAGVAHFFAMDEMPKVVEPDTVYVAQSWWQNGLATIGKLYKTLEIIADSKSTALAIDDFNPLLQVPADRMAESERVSRIFSGLQQWAVENAVIVFIGAPVIDGKVPVYGNLPQFPVTLSTTSEGKFVHLAGEKFSISAD
jgi:uncharacterized membrane protein